MPGLQLQVPLSCLSISCLPSAKVRQSPDWHESLEQEPRGHIHADRNVGDSPKHFPLLPKPRSPHKTKAMCPWGLSQPGKKSRGPTLTSPGTCLSSERQPVSSEEPLGFPKHTASHPQFSSSLQGFAPTARPAVGSGQDRGALRPCTLGGRRLLMLTERRQALFSSSFPPQLLFLPKLFKDRTPGLMTRIKNRLPRLPSKPHLALPTQLHTGASTSLPSHKSPEPLALSRPSSSTHCLNLSPLFPS